MGFLVHRTRRRSAKRALEFCNVGGAVPVERFVDKSSSSVEWLVDVHAQRESAIVQRAKVFDELHQFVHLVHQCFVDCRKVDFVFDGWLLCVA